MNFFAWLKNLFKPAPKVTEPKPGGEQVPKEVQNVYEAFRNSPEFTDPRYIAEINYAINSSKPRLFIWDRKEQKLYKHKVAHGSGGKNETPHDGWCREVSNKTGSHMSCVGLFKCGTTYESPKNGYSMRLHGLETTNSNAYSRAIVMHKMASVVDSNNNISGRSWGCPGVDPRHYKKIIGMLKEGSPLYSSL